MFMMKDFLKKLKLFISTTYKISYGLVFKGELLAKTGVAENRMMDCYNCEHFKDPRCKVCGCFMHAKVHFKNATCPLAKW